jgi:hypothetical protein
VKALPSLALLAACGAGPDLPDGWGGARELPLAQPDCFGAPTAELPRLSLSTASDGTVTATLDSVGRCAQRQCGYLLEGDAARVLIQPCDMHPRSVGKCACTAQVIFIVPASAGRTGVEVWWRPDFYGRSAANQPMRVPAR